MSNPTSRLRALTKLGAKLGLAFGSLAVALVVAELAVRGWLAARGTPYDANAALEALKSAAHPMQALAPTAGSDPNAPAPAGPPRMILHPFTGSEGLHDTGGVLAAFRKGTLNG